MTRLICLVPKRLLSFMLATALATVLQTVASAQDAATPRKCPIDNRWYSLRTTADNWDDARIVASRTTLNGKAGQLAVIEDQRVLVWIYETYFIFKPRYVYTGGMQDVNAPEPAGNWFWFIPGFNRRPINMGKAFWLAGEPNNFKGIEDRVVIDFDRGGKFADVSKNGQYPYLIQY